MSRRPPAFPPIRVAHHLERRVLDARTQPSFRFEPGARGLIYLFVIKTPPLRPTLLFRHYRYRKNRLGHPRKTCFIIKKLINYFFFKCILNQKLSIRDVHHGIV